jgi:hypothetical protein
MIKVSIAENSFECAFSDIEVIACIRSTTDHTDLVKGFRNGFFFVVVLLLALCPILAHFAQEQTTQDEIEALNHQKIALSNELKAKHLANAIRGELRVEGCVFVAI